MRHSRLCLSLIVTATIAGAAGQNFALAQTETPSQTPAPAAPTPSVQPPSPALGPYKPVPITLPKSVSDPSFDAFRKELAEIAQKRDRAALGERVAANFFWIPETADLADKQRSGIDNLAKALALDARDGVGWDTITAYAGEASAAADPQRAGIVCSPVEATFEDAAADELANTTQTDATDWVFPIRDGVDVRSAARQDAAVIETLGLHLVRVIPDESPANAVLSVIKVLTPSGKIGFIPLESVLPIGGEQMCYVKEPSGWKIAGFLGGEANQ
ncbi:MAG TPA: hypothetical protein VH678_29895 [Xanthobacteraceae bacterium]|jgi:hypothetical protein